VGEEIQGRQEGVGRGHDSFQWAASTGYAGYGRGICTGDGVGSICGHGACVGVSCAVYPELVESIEHQAYGCHGKKSGKTVDSAGDEMKAAVKKIKCNTMRYNELQQNTATEHCSRTLQQNTATEHCSRTLQ
jgi:hypothetical protein